MTTRKPIEIYIKTWCPYSIAALTLLDELGAEYETIDVTEDAAREAEMIARSGRRTVPEVFADGELIGGYDDLVRLRREHRLAEVLGLAPAVKACA